MKNFLSVIILSALVLSACGKYQEPTANGTPTTPQTATGSVTVPAQLAAIQRPLIDRYFRITEHNGDRSVNSQDFIYRPRQSEFSAQKGWDVLTPPWPWAAPSDGKWLTFRLNRNATVTLLVDEWAEEAQQTAWLKDWTPGTTSAKNAKGGDDSYVSFSKAFRAGDVTLPAIQEYQYILLLAEVGGVPSAEPALPQGITEDKRPRANQPCEAWLHSAWQAPGPDGKMYQSWHPQIDPVYWCYYEHDHGSDPALIGYPGAAFGYVAEYNTSGGISQPELPVGFKGFAFRDEAKGLGWYINIHAETGVKNRACARVHTVTFVATDLKDNNKVLLELSYKGDYGVPRSNQEDKLLDPLDCPAQNEVAMQQELEDLGFRASRSIRVFSNGQDPGGYEQWDGGANTNLGMSFGWFPGMGIDIRNPATGCNTVQCSEVLPTGLNDPKTPDSNSNADMRTLEFRELTIEYDKLMKANDLTDGKQDGYFMTDVYGEVQADPMKNVIRQYMVPGFKQTLDFEHVLTTQDAWRALYIHEAGHQSGLELEDSLGKNN